MKNKYKILFLLILLAIISINAISATEINANGNDINAIDADDGIKIEKISEKIILDDEANGETNLDNTETDNTNEDLTNASDTDQNITEPNETDSTETNETNTTETNETDSTETNETNTTEPDETDPTEPDETNTTEPDDSEEEPDVQIDTRLYHQSSVLKGKYLNIVLKDVNENPIANQQIRFNLLDKVYTRTTDENGTAKLKINLNPKTYSFFIEYDGSDEYIPTNLVFDLDVIKPVGTKLSVKSSIVYKNNNLIVYLKTSANKALAKQKVKITLLGKTYERTTDKNGAVSLKIRLSPKSYSININYSGKGKYLASSKKIKLNVFENQLLGSTFYGKVELLKVIGNASSKVKIAYVVGLHPIEYQIHDAVYNIMKKKTSMHYAYYVYKITLTKKTGDYSTDRMRGQLLAKNFIVPHINKQKYKLVVDVHSTTGTYYKNTYFIHVPQNKHKASLNLANKTIKIINSLDKKNKIIYWSPESQTSPPYLTLPIMKAGTPTFVYETLTSEPVSQTNYRANILVNAIDKIFG